MTETKTTLLAIYDMDKTVTRRATYNGFLLHMAFNKAPWRLLLAPFLPIGLLLYALKIWDRSRLKQFSQTLLIGRRVPKAHFAKYLESHADLVVGKNVYPQLLARVAEEKAAGYRHVMATASYRLYVEAIAKRLGFDDVIATDLSTDSSGHVTRRCWAMPTNLSPPTRMARLRDWRKRRAGQSSTGASREPDPTLVHPRAKPPPR